MEIGERGARSWKFLSIYRHLRRAPNGLVEAEAHGICACLWPRGDQRLSDERPSLDEVYEALRRAHVDNLNLQDALRLERSEGPNDAYARWLDSRKLRPRDLIRLRTLSRALSHQPKLSVIVATFDTTETHLRAALDSVFAQTYENWELCVADDASTQPQVRRILQEYAARSPRVKTVFRSENGHISRATNSALEVAQGDFVCLLDHDDVLTPDALFEVALLLNVSPDADFIYSDEDKLDDATGQLVDPYFKPDWCPDSILSRMYTAHLGVYRRSLVEQLGGMREGFEGSQDHDLVLRLVERTHRIHHIPRVLYHWRIHTTSTASKIQAKPYAVMAAQRAVSEAIERRGQPGTVLVLPDCPGTYIVRYQIGFFGRVLILVSPDSNVGNLDRCLDSILSHDAYADFEVALLPDSTDRTMSEACRRRASNDSRVRLSESDVFFNRARLRNKLIVESDAMYVVLMNGDTEVATPDWLSALIEQAQRPTVGAVGPAVSRTRWKRAESGPHPRHRRRCCFGPPNLSARCFRLFLHVALDQQLLGPFRSLHDAETRGLSARWRT